MQRSSNIRVRLLFEDCTPLRAGSVGRRKCWFLLNIDACRRVTDVEYCIQKSFCLGRSSQIELLLDDFVLPPFEKSEIIQENDLIRVRLVCEGDQQREVQVEEQHGVEPNHPSKRKKANTEAEPFQSSKDVPHTSTAKRKKAQKERKGMNNEKRDSRLANGQKGSQGIEQTTDVGQTSRLVNSVQVSDVSPSVKNGTPKHSARAHKHTVKSVKTTRGLDSSSSSSASSSEDDEQAKAITKSKRLRKIAGRRKVQPSKSVTPSTTRVQSSLNSGMSTSGVLGSKPTRSSGSNSKCNGSGPLHSESESSSTEEEADTISRKRSLKVLRSGLPSKKPTAGCVKGSEGKKPVMTRTVNTSTSSSASSMSSASSSSDDDENPSVQLKQKQTMQSSAQLGAALSTKRVDLSTPLEAEGKALSSKKSAVVKKSKSKSSSGHVRFSSDCDSSESEVAGGMQPSASKKLPSSQPAQLMNPEQGMSSVIPRRREGNAMEMGVPHNAGQELKGERSKDCITHSALDDTNGSTTDGIQAKLLNIAGQKPKQPVVKPKQPPKPKQPKKPKDYSSYPPLVGPPRSGDCIAYKILELSNSYTPEVSDYKEGEVINFNYSNSMIELRLSDVAMAAEPKRDGGKFEMETEENQAEQAKPAPVDRLVLVTLPSLIDPKLVT